MQVEVRSAEGVMTVESDVPISVGGILDKLGIAHSTVLAVVGETLRTSYCMAPKEITEILPRGPFLQGYEGTGSARRGAWRGTRRA